MTREPWRTHAAELLTREAQVLELLADTPVPAPRLVGTAVSGVVGSAGPHEVSTQVEQHVAGVEVAVHEARVDVAAGGRLTFDPYWDVVDAIGFLPDPEKVAAPWRAAGRPDLGAAVARRRLEAYVSSLRASASRS